EGLLALVGEPAARLRRRLEAIAVVRRPSERRRDVHGDRHTGLLKPRRRALPPFRNLPPGIGCAGKAGARTRTVTRVAEPPRPPLGSHYPVCSLASRRASPSLRGRRSARTTPSAASPHGARRRASAAAARLALPLTQVPLAGI